MKPLNPTYEELRGCDVNIMKHSGFTIGCGSPHLKNNYTISRIMEYGNTTDNTLSRHGREREGCACSHCSRCPPEWLTEVRHAWGKGGVSILVGWEERSDRKDATRYPTVTTHLSFS